MSAPIRPRSALAPLESLDPIGLDELLERAALQTRVDRKYIVPTEALADVLGDLDDASRVLQIDDKRAFAYESVYFDSPDLVNYRAAALSRRRRSKIRTRTYVDAHESYLEVKTRGARSTTVKDRLPYDPDARGALTPDGVEYVDGILSEASIPGAQPDAMRSVLTTRYDRTTLFVPGSESRATIDTALEWELEGGSILHLDDIVIVETKSGSRASDVDRLLWAHGHRPVGISKYGTGLAALRPDLPSSKWARVIRRYFDTRPERSAA